MRVGAVSVMTILVVEDDSAIRRLIVRTLERYGFDTLEARSAKAALDLFQVHRDSIDLTIADIVMPGMSGLDLAAELERQAPGMTILYMSGYATSLAVESIARSHPDAMLVKPFNATMLIEHVGRLIARKESRSATLAAGNPDTLLHS